MLLGSLEDTLGSRLNPAFHSVNLSQALSGKGALRVFFLLDLALPAFVGPGGCAEADQRREGEGHSA